MLMNRARILLLIFGALVFPVAVTSCTSPGNTTTQGESEESGENENEEDD